MFRAKVLRFKLNTQMIEHLIGQDRIDEKMSNRDLIAKLIHVMLALDFYKDCFEQAFLDETAEFFSKNYLHSVPGRTSEHFY